MFFSGTLRSVCWFFAIDLNDLSFSSSLVCLLPYIGPRTDIATQDAADDVVTRMYRGETAGQKRKTEAKITALWWMLVH